MKKTLRRNCYTCTYCELYRNEPYCDLGHVNIVDGATRECLHYRPTAEPAMAEKKYCCACGKVYELGAFPRDRAKRDGRDNYCAACRAERTRDYMIRRTLKEMEEEKNGRG